MNFKTNKLNHSRCNVRKFEKNIKVSVWYFGFSALRASTLAAAAAVDLAFG